MFAGRSLDAKRAQYQVLIANLSALGCGLRILFEVPAGIWGKPHPIDVGFRVDVHLREDSSDSQIRVATRQRGKAAHKSRWRALV